MHLSTERGVPGDVSLGAAFGSSSWPTEQGSGGVPHQGDDFAPARPLGQYLEPFWVTTTGDECCWRLVGKARGAAKHPTVHGNTPPHKCH